MPKLRFFIPTPTQLMPFILCAFGVSNIVSPTGIISQYLVTRTNGIYDPQLFALICIFCGLMLAFRHERPLAYWLCNLPIVFYSMGAVLYLIETQGQSQPAVIYLGFIGIIYCHVYHALNTYKPSG